METTYEEREYEEQEVAIVSFVLESDTNSEVSFRLIKEQKIWKVRYMPFYNTIK
ncbi:hypothetical protein VBD025_04870 [Virgibacillus flavescens]|uniref:hypothetical protein n=1 Tax=Virgibacillus flavescens TaxID=1611422 RepID=UPI003D356BB2